MSRAIARAVISTLVCVGIGVGATEGTVDAAAEITISTAGPLGPVTVIGDSVLFGSGFVQPDPP